MVGNGNDDIFDQEALLAIANDGSDGSSSPSCHSSTGSEGVKNENDALRLHSPPPQDGDTDSTLSKRKEEAASRHPGISGCSKTATLSIAREKDDLRYSKKESEIEPSPNCHVENIGGSCSSDDSSHDDDDGFLESWFKMEKETEPNAEPSKSADVVQKEKSVDKIQIEESINGSDGEKSKDEDHGNNKNRIELGASVLRWISAKKCDGGAASALRRSASAPSTYNDVVGVVAVQHSNEEAAISQTPSTLHLTTHYPVANPRKRPCPGNVYGKATVEEIPQAGSNYERASVKCGQAVHASNANRVSTPGTMVDCLARYDPKKGCYVLEIVDLLVSKLKPLSDAQDSENTATIVATTDATAKATLHKSTDIFDPRSIAKRAEDQLRKLKQGKGRDGVSKKKRKKEFDASPKDNIK